MGWESGRVMSDKEIEIIRKLESEIKDLVDILKGKDGKDGMIAKVNRHEQWINSKDRDFYGTFNFIYRTAIALVLGYIAWKIGLRP